MKRPIALTIIAWGAIVTGTLAVLSGSMAVWSARMSPEEVSSPFESRLVAFMFRHFVLFAAVQVGVGGLVVAAGASLLRLRRWAARVLELVAWAVLVYALVFTGIFAREILVKAGHNAQVAGGFNLGRFVLLFVSANLLVWCAPLTAAIISLRRATNRALLV